MGRFLARTALCLICLGGSGSAPAEDASGFGEEVSVGYVLVPVVVRGAAGYVTDLDRRDFELLVDGRPVTFDAFESGPDGPISVLFAQDLSGSMGVPPKLELSRRIARCFLDRRRPGDRFAIATFAGELLTVDVPFTGDPSVLDEALELWQGYGRTALHDAVAWLPRVTLSEASMRRAAVLVTDGVDNASAVEPTTARERVREAKLPVYVFGLSTGSPYALDGEGEKIFRYADVLNLLAALSGGRYHATFREDEIDAACANIVQEMRHQYVLGFPLAATGSDSEHEIEVVVSGRRREVSFRKGYHGRAPRGPGAENDGGRNPR